jgi:hypothetical protein
MARDHLLPRVLFVGVREHDFGDAMVTTAVSVDVPLRIIMPGRKSGRVARARFTKHEQHDR